VAASYQLGTKERAAVSAGAPSPSGMAA
jgi:hypothetical protein